MDGKSFMKNNHDVLYISLGFALGFMQSFIHVIHVIGLTDAIDGWRVCLSPTMTRSAKIIQRPILP